MSDSSGDTADILSKVEAKHVRRLLSVVFESRLRKLQFVEQRYTEGAANFRETLQFLRDLGWISERGDELDLVPSISAVSDWLQSEDSIRHAILTALAGESSPYRRAVASYLSNFTVADAELKYRPSLSERGQQRPLRNLLMDLRTVSYRPADETYILEDSAVPIYVWATNFVRPRGRQTYEVLQRRREELGFAAELAVVEHERKRLGGGLAHLVEHISADQPYACYDVKSATVMEGRVVDRYIEVKAVPQDTLQFYWSKSEVDAAIVLRERYYLYLLPYAVKRGFDVEALTMICNPHRTLTGDQDTWEIEEDVLVCRRKHVTQETD
jgi:hypothetical protein